VTDAAVTELAPQVGVRAACQALGHAQAGYYRRHRISPAPVRPALVAHRDRPQPRALTEQEQKEILDVLHSPRFVDLAPAEVWATLLDEGVYLGSISTFYRLLRRAGESRERRRQATHPASVKPELVASAPNRVWSWDITKLHGPAKWTYYYLYVILEPVGKCCWWCSLGVTAGSDLVTVACRAGRERGSWYWRSNQLQPANRFLLDGADPAP
jgi:putative transposase